MKSKVIKKKGLSLILLILLLALFVSSCAKSNNKSNTIDQPQIKIGGVFHLTGPASFWGQGESEGATLAVEEINAKGGIEGKPVELLIEDGKTDFSQTAIAIHKLIETDDASIIVGPTWFGQVAAPIAQESGHVIISPSTGVTIPRKGFFFNLWPTESQEIIPLVSFMTKRNVSRIVLIYSQNDWSVSMKQTFLNESLQYGISVIKEIPTLPDESDFRSVILSIEESDADAVYAPFAFYPSQGAFSKQAKELNLTIPVYSSSGTQNPDLLKAFPDIEGTIYPYPVPGAGEPEFNSKFQARFNKLPSPSSAYAYDAVKIAAQSLAAGYQTQEDLSNYLSSRTFSGTTNNIALDKTTGRVMGKEHEVRQVINGQFVRIS